MAGILGLHVEAAAIGRPDGFAHGQIQACLEFALVAAVSVHQVQAMLLVGQNRVVKASKGNGLTVGRDDGGKVGAIAIGERREAAVGQAQAV